MFAALLIAAGLVLFPAQGTSTGAIQGVVREAGSHAPIARAVVFVSGGGVSTDTRTDTDGRFAFSALPPGTYEVLAAKPGFLFDRRSTPAVTVSSGRTTPITLEMARETPPNSQK